jgi:excisionase family DNA binding protein
MPPSRPWPPEGPDRPEPSTLAVALPLTPDLLDAIAERVAERIPSPTAEHFTPWLNSAQAADYIAAPKGRVHDLVQLGKLTPRRDGTRLLFHRDELDAYVESGAS